MTGHRLWMILSDEDGNPTEGIEVRGLLSPVEVSGGEPVDDPLFGFTDQIRYRPPDPFIITVTGREVTLYRPTDDGNWTPAESP